MLDLGKKKKKKKRDKKEKSSSSATDKSKSSKHESMMEDQRMLLLNVEEEQAKLGDARPKIGLHVRGVAGPRDVDLAREQCRPDREEAQEHETPATNARGNE